MNGGRQIGLDAVRGGAILLVLLFHFNRPVGIGAFDMALAPFRSAGWAGVELFFVLSGFLVGGIILRDSEAPRGFDPARFALRRAFRLWPILYLYVALLAYGGVPWDGIWPVLLHVQNYSPAARSHLWSLAVEEHFYLAAALVLPWLARRLSPRRIVAALVALIVAVNLADMVALAAGVPLEQVHRQTHFRIDALAAGVLLAAGRHYWPARFARIARRRGLLLALAALGFAAVVLTPPVARQWGVDLALAWWWAVPLVLAAASDGAGASSPLRAMAWLGRIAYPLYIWHLCAGNIAATLGAAAGISSPLALLLLQIGGAIGFAALLHHAIELPFLRLRDRLPLDRHGGAREARVTA